MSDETPINSDNEYRTQRYEAYIKEREGLQSATLEISGRYDKSILFLAGGGLALSLTFIEKIAPHPQPWSFFVLFAAWVCLILAVMFELHALATSQTAINEQVSSLDSEYQRYLDSLSQDAAEVRAVGAAATQENVYTEKTRWLNKWSLRFLGTGVLLLCIFSMVNLPFTQTKSDMADSKTATALLSKGSYVPPKNALPPPPPPQPKPQATPAAPEK